jgi:hypothetical protein
MAPWFRRRVATILMIVQWRAYDQMPSYLIIMFGEFEMLILTA